MFLSFFFFWIQEGRKFCNKDTDLAEILQVKIYVKGALLKYFECQ